MIPNRSNRRVHSPEFKAQVIGECQQPGASVAAVAIGYGLNPNVVRKWLAGQNRKRMDAAMPASAPHMAPLQFVPIELAKSDHLVPKLRASQPDVRVELDHGGLRLKLQGAASSGPAYASLLRALADTMVGV